MSSAFLSAASDKQGDSIASRPTFNLVTLLFRDCRIKCRCTLTTELDYCEDSEKTCATLPNVLLVVLNVWKMNLATLVGEKKQRPVLKNKSVPELAKPDLS
jgi:hypothetical protein